MITMFIEFGVFTISLVMALFFQVKNEGEKYRDCQLFGRLLLACVAILFVDTLGWVIDGNPIGGQVWITTIVDGLDLIFTTVVCWCWVKYAIYIASNGQEKSRKWYLKLENILLILQVVLVVSSQLFGFYFSVDETGAYHREQGYFIHTLISLLMLAYSSISCVRAYTKTKEKDRKRELLFVTLIILVPIAGNIFQLYVYGYPTIWLCMVFMVLVVYIHIQNKRISKEQELQNKALTKALEQAQSANAAKTDFLARMSHDMRTPMNGILGLSYIMQDQEDINEIKKEIPKLRESGEYLLQLINDVLDVNKVESGKIELHPKPCDERQVFESIIALVEPLMKQKNITFNFEKINIEWTYMSMDVPRVKQIFVNLLSNAAKFTPEGGRVDFVMELVSENEKMIRDKFIIRDSGIGMSEDFLPHIFEPFMQEGRIIEGLGGTGLGLTIVKSVVELMDGSIEVKSEVNKGTEFIVYINFPLVPKPQNSNERAKTITEVLPNNLHILMCEDHPLNAQIGTRLLESQNAIVDWKQNGKLGLEAFEQSEFGYYDVVLMDIRMPVMDGIEATKAIRALDREDATSVPIIAMTANAYEEDVEKSLSAGMNAHLAKPIEPQKMFETIAEYTTNCL